MRREETINAHSPLTRLARRRSSWRSSVVCEPGSQGPRRDGGADAATPSDLGCQPSSVARDAQLPASSPPLPAARLCHRPGESWPRAALKADLDRPSLSLIASGGDASPSGVRLAVVPKERLEHGRRGRLEPRQLSGLAPADVQSSGRAEPFGRSLGRRRRARRAAGAVLGRETRLIRVHEAGRAVREDGDAQAERRLADDLAPPLRPRETPAPPPPRSARVRSSSASARSARAGAVQLRRRWLVSPLCTASCGFCNTMDGSSGWCSLHHEARRSGTRSRRCGRFCAAGFSEFG